MGLTAARDLRVLFAGGGTGGHIMPGAATARALSELFPQGRCLFLTTSRASERHCCEAIEQFERAEVPAVRWDGGLQKFRFAAEALSAGRRSLSIMRDFRPHVLVGLGGCSCAAPVLVGKALGVPTMIFEANAVPGRVVRLLAPLADCVQLQWEAAAASLRARRVLRSGTPVRPGIFSADARAAREQFVLSSKRCTLLVMGGSQGALSLNRLLWGALKRLNAPPARIPPGRLQVLHLTGPDHLEEARRADVPMGIVYRSVGFLERMEDAYAAADFVLARAGGSSLAELTALGLPSILVPYPHARDDHQSANAEVLVRAGAALSAAQGELSPGKLAALIADLANHPERLARMARAARAIGRPDAAWVVAGELAAMARLNLRRPAPAGGEKRAEARALSRAKTAA